jgi:integrase/recombinase XerC
VVDEQIITELLSVTKGKDYEAIRDHAIVRLLLTGMRRQELVSLRVDGVDLTARVLVTVGLKRKHALADGCGCVQPACSQRRHRAAVAGVAKPVGADRQWHQSDVAPSRGAGRVPARCCPPALFRHTRAHQHLADGGSEGDLMQTMGWSDRSVIDRYGASLAQSRALADSHRRGLVDRRHGGSRPGDPRSRPSSFGEAPAAAAP